MENKRFLLYLVVLAMVFLILAAIKKLSPHHEPVKPVDQVGMNLYRPIFFGTPHETSLAQVKTKDTEAAFIDPVAEKEVADKADAEQPQEKVKPKVPDQPKRSENLSNENYFDALIEDYNANVLSKRKYRNDVVVRYYKHQPDEDRASVLVDYGFYLHERKVVNTVRFETLMSNVIYYGKDFPERDLELITYLLVSSGIEIKAIRKFKDFDGWKRNAIEIGGDPKLADKEAMSLDQIRAISNLN